MAFQNVEDALPPRVRDAIRERFDEIYPLFTAAYRSASESTVSLYRDACLSDSAALRRSVLDYVESLHSDLRFRLSACARVNQLPDDVLVYVMSTMSHQELVIATHVCHRWRKLGVETPALWTRLALTDTLVGASGVLLARSKAASLDLEIGISNPLRRINDPALLLGPYMERVRSLSIRSQKRPSKRRDRQPFYDQPFYNFGVGLPAPIQMPVPRQVTPQMQLSPAPRLETLLIDVPFGANVDDRISFDCSMLREAYIIQGTLNVDFLRPCRQLRVLVLRIPGSVTSADVLRIVRANPKLRTLELHVPLDWGHAGLLWGVADGADAADAANSGTAKAAIACELERLIVRSESAGGVTNPLYEAILVMMSRFNCSHTREVEILCSFDGTGDDFGHALLAHLQEVTSTVLGPDLLRLEDTRGYVRRFLNMSPSRPLHLALPFLRHVRFLDAQLSQWSALPTHRVLELPALEELILRGGLSEFAAMQPGTACPALRKLTLVESWGGQVTPQADDAADFFTVAMDIPRERLCRCAPLRQLTIVHETDRTPSKDLTLHFNPPAPRTVIVTSVAPDPPKLHRESPDYGNQLSLAADTVGASIEEFFPMEPGSIWDTIIDP
ncbi:hypothetical protein AURDEDRAFT_167510 [Auricularia subglabra TFB-10046 SS5]|nr:hypothetical protein AURDEDRAFT_167510 [Auricularia subglabra TFB-10046 SS5]